MSDTGRDTIAEGLASLFGAVGWGALAVIAVVVLVAALFGGIRRMFPAKVHRWCGGKGHWGIGPFRRRCGACSGSGLVDR
jgi:hypothetical protein